MFNILLIHLESLLFNVSAVTFPHPGTI
ncbi:hypothetical protein PT2222_120176 [Paraburkholderia tropica]